MSRENPAAMLPKLDARLQTVASLVRSGSRCADIGTDHGYLIAWLTASGRIPGGYACDINEKPLQKAAFSLRACGAEDRVKRIKCDGLAGLRAGDADDIVIAGMGGELIWDILSTPAWTRDPKLRFILQPMTRAQRLRRLLYTNGFVLLREEPVVCGKFCYSVMQAAYDGLCKEPTPAFCWGGLLLGRREEAARRYLCHTANRLRVRVQGLRRSGENPVLLEEYRQIIEALEA